MPSNVDWKEVSLGEVLELKRGYDLPKDKRTPGTVPIVSSSGISDFHSLAMVKGPGVVTGRYGTIGEVFYVGEDYWPLNTTLYVRDFKGNDPRFISYLLKTLDFQAYSDKGAVPGLNRNHLHLAKVRIHGKVTQKNIARVLSSLDSKIDLNRRINQTLEAMAQAIFKSWFVDFDPVKAKIAAIQEGRDPLRAAMSAISGKSDAELDAIPPEQYAELASTAAQFPDEMYTSELGEIPRGWLVRAMPDCIEVNPARTLKKGAVAQYLDMANVPTNSARVQNVVPREFTSGSKFRNGDTLLARITPCLENGKTAFVDFLNSDEVGWGSTEFIVLRPRNGLPEPFAYFLCRHPDFRAFAIAQMAGTSGRQRVPNDCFGGYKLVEPATQVAIKFGQFADAVLNQIKALDEEARTLASLRDALLPKLLSGELPVVALAEPADTP
ncbi:MAG TPA: restriction endonuclease subunit S [Burkholderiaceae bacterium]|nr:restriction endonuclease subunit S [Burkholderiaceae bacterium]